MEKIITTVQVNGNEVQLIKETNKYYIYWGEVKEKYRTKTELNDLYGNPLKESLAIKKFLEAAEAARYLKFEKL